jgi:hypothetical protein
MFIICCAVSKIPNWDSIHRQGYDKVLENKIPGIVTNSLNQKWTSEKRILNLFSIFIMQIGLI